MCIGLVLTLFLADLSLKSNICSSPGDWLISRSLATTVRFPTGSKTQDALFSPCYWDPRLSSEVLRPPPFSERLWHYQDSLQLLLYVQLLRGNPEGCFAIISIIIITILRRGCQKGIIAYVPMSGSTKYPLAVPLAHTAAAARTASPPNQPASPKLWLRQIKGAFYGCDSLLEEAVYCWIFRVMAFSTDACVGTWAPVSNTSLSISDKSWLHRLALRGQNHLRAQDEAVTCIIFALQSKHALYFFLKREK